MSKKKITEKERLTNITSQIVKNTLFPSKYDPNNSKPSLPKVSSIILERNKLQMELKEAEEKAAELIKMIKYKDVEIENNVESEMDILFKDIIKLDLSGSEFWFNINSLRNSKLLYLNGYLFRKSSSNKDVQYWKCSAEACVARLHTPIDLNSISSVDQIKVVAHHTLEICKVSKDDLAKRVLRIQFKEKIK